MNLLMATVELIHLMNWTSVSCIYDHVESLGKLFLIVIRGSSDNEVY